MEHGFAEMTLLENMLKQLLEQRPDMRNKILTADELIAYISWTVDKYGDYGLTVEDVSPFIGDASRHRHAELVLKNPEDKQALKMLSADYAVQSERRFILTGYDITVGRMIRYMPGYWHRSDYFEIYYAPYGKCPIHFDNETVMLSQGAVLIVAPNVAHAAPCYSDDAVLHYFLARTSTFDKVFWGQLSNGNLMASFFRKVLSGEKEVAWLYFDTFGDMELLGISEKMQREFREAGNYSSQMLNTLMTEFFILTLKKYENTARLSRTDDFFWRHEYSELLSYIQRNFAEVNIEDVAREFHYSTRQVSRMIKSITNLNYAQLVRKLKMERAADLLERENISLKAIAHALGYSDISSFHRAFTAYYDISPGVYRSLHELK